MISLNGKPYENAPSLLVALLLREGITKDTKGVAVACNGAVVPRAEWETTALHEGDQVEVVRIMQGG